MKQRKKIYSSLMEIDSKKTILIENIANVSNVAQSVAATTEGVGASSEEQAAGLQEIVGSAERLNELAENLDSIIKMFKV